MGGADDEEGFDEFGGDFKTEVGLDIYQAVFRLVLSAYGYRCALTGEQFAPDPSLIHPHLEVIAIRPREAGGPLQVNNFLALEEHAARAFVAGQILIGNDYQVIPDFTVLDRAVATRLHPGGKLLIPAERLFWPDPQYLNYHRARILRN